jgi:hypothetical protein
VKSLGLAVADLKSAVHQNAAYIDSESHRGMTAALYQGLIWVRDHTKPCDVLAVNNHYVSASMRDSRYFYYSAFTERRVFLESWDYTQNEDSGRQPFAARLALNDLATLRGESTALGRLAHDGIGFVLIDKTHGGGAHELPNAARLIFRNSAVDVYRLMVSHDSRQGQQRCAT